MGNALSSPLEQPEEHVHSCARKESCRGGLVNKSAQ